MAGPKIWSGTADDSDEKDAATEKAEKPAPKTTEKSK